MAIINFAHREITAKVVYYGPPGAGVNTNVKTLYDLAPVDERSRLHKFGPGNETERTWYFDYVPAGGGDVDGFSLRFRVYSIPGGLTHAAHRREVLKGTDAVVFVADARPGKDQINLDSLLDLERSLKQEGIEMAAIPMVLQVNHTDSTNARPADEVVFDLNPYGFPVVRAVARAAKGVLETHDKVTAVTTARIRENLSGNETAITLTAVHRNTRLRDEDIIARHLSAIEAEERAARLSGGEGWDDVPVGGEIEVPYQPDDFAGTRPVQLLGAAIDGDEIHLDLVMERLSGGTPRRLHVHLANRPTDAPPLPRVATLTASEPRVTDSLPEIVEIRTPPPPSDFPPVWYGIAGLASGILIGLLIGVLALL